MIKDAIRGLTDQAAAYVCAAAVSAAAFAAVTNRSFFFAADIYPFITGWFLLCAVLIGYGVLAVSSPGQVAGRTEDRLRRSGRTVIILLSIPFVMVLLYALHGLMKPLSALGTLNEMLRWSFYGTFAVLVCIAAGQRRSARLITAVWHLTGMTLAVSALLAACGGLPLPYAIAYSTAPGFSATGARLGGLLQYPNTFGAVMAVFLLERLFAVAAAPGRTALLRLLPLFPYTAALLLSQSRGAWLAAACASAAALLWKRRQLAPLLAAGAAPVAAAALLYRQLAAARLAAEPLPGLLALAGLWAGALLAGLWLCRRLRSAAGKPRAAMLALAALGWTAGGTAVLLHVHARMTGPSTTASARALFYRDAWRLAAEAPWLGRGGETWRNVYLAAQSHPYVGSQLHNGYLDILLNLGITGLFATLLMLAAMCRLLAAWSPRLVPPFLVIVLHGAVDFDWSYGIVWLLLFWLPALARADHLPAVRESSMPAGTARRCVYIHSRRFMAAAVCWVCLTLSFMAWQADRGEVLFRKSLSAAESAEKKTLLQQSLHRNPLSPQAAVELSRLLPREQSIRLLHSSLLHSPENPGLTWRRAEVELEGENPGAALYWVRRGLDLDSYNYGKRTQAVQSMLLMSQRRLAAGDKKGARYSASAGLELLRQYRLLAEGAERGGHNDRRFHLTERAVGLGQRLESLTQVSDSRSQTHDLDHGL